MQHKIYLIDAYAHIYRGFHAVQNLSTKDGRPSNAIFAFARFLISLEKEYSPDFGAVVFDMWPPAARLKLHPEYKAQRPPMPDNMRAQISTIRELIKLAGWKIIEKEEHEADDLIAALSEKFHDEKVYIISNDKDLSQLVTDNIHILATSPGVKGYQERTAKEILDKFGVAPSQITDYLSLTGDSSDNIIGIDGLGPKTASKLIQEYSTLENLIENLDNVANEKLKTKLKENIELLKMNRQLIALDKKAPTGVSNIEDIRTGLPDVEGLDSLCRGFELFSLVDEFSKICNKKANPTLF